MSLGVRVSWLIAALWCLLAAPVRARDLDPWFAPDKALHFGVSAGLASGSYAGSSLVFDEPWQRALVAAGFTLSVGAGKELYDATGQGDPSLRDFTWDALGCAVGVGIAYLIDLATRPADPTPSRSARP